MLGRIPLSQLSDKSKHNKFYKEIKGNFIWPEKIS